MFLEKVPFWSDDGYSCGDPIYQLLDVAKHCTELVELIPKRAWLAINKPDELHVEYALLEFAMSNSDGTEIGVKVVFFGSGPSGSLREMRHTYFTNDVRDVNGYLFYAPVKAITAAFQYLTKYFDIE